MLYIFILFACSVNAEQFKITGTVVDETNEPVIGAGVAVVGTDRHTATNLDGNFSIEVEKGEILEFSCVGYFSKKVEVLNDSSLFIELVPNEADWDIEDFVGCKYGFTEPILSPDSFDFSLPESELKKLPLYDESLRGEFIQLDEHQIGRAKYLVYEEINKDVKNPLISKMRLGRYARQFLGVKHNGRRGVKHNGRRIVFINLVSSSLMPQFNDRLSNSLITVDDGANGFGRAIVDLTNEKVIMLRMNGE